MGLSPRGRGNLLVQPQQDLEAGSIPAWAGQPWPYSSSVRYPGVYPRVGGATSGLSVTLPFASGLSPRGRGNRLSATTSYDVRGSIPAWAGQPLTSACRARWQWVYPRVGGATGGIAVGSRDPMGLSPRGRGNPHPVYHPPASCGSIPAWAGQPLRRPLRSCQIAVYPRVGGATLTNVVAGDEMMGLSPRGRGNL